MTSNQSLEIATPSEGEEIVNEPQEKEMSHHNFYQYKWNEGHWAKILGQSCEEDVMRRDLLDPRIHYDPMTWKFMTSPDHRHRVPTGNRTPIVGVLKKHRHRDEGISKKHKRQVKSKDEKARASITSMAQSKHTVLSGEVLNAEEEKDKESKSKKSSRKDRKSTAASYPQESVVGDILCPRLQVIKVTHFSIEIQWYEFEEEESSEEAVKNQDEMQEDLAKAKKKASLLAEKLGDSRCLYTLQYKAKDSIRDWAIARTGYGMSFVVENLKPLTAYMFRLRAFDHEQNIHSLWSETLLVETKRSPYSVLDVLQKIALDDLNGLIEIMDTGEVNPNAEDPVGMSPLMRAALKDKIKIMQALMRRGADPNFQSREQRRTAMMVACYSGQLKALKCLRLFEASYEFYDSSHLYAIHWAVDSGNTELMEYMLGDGANPEALDNQGWSPLHRCALVGVRTEGIAEVLIRYGAKIDRVDKDLKTPLMLATISNKGLIAQTLINRGADVMVPNKEGRSVYDLARALERRGIVMLLEEYAKANEKELSELQGQGIKGGTTTMDQDEIKNLDKMAKNLPIRKVKKSFEEE